MSLDKVWISVEDRLPQEGIRVWASTGGNDVGHDCYIGYKPANFLQSIRDGFYSFGEVCWRDTDTGCHYLLLLNIKKRIYGTLKNLEWI